MCAKATTQSVGKKLVFIMPVNGRIPKYGHIYNILKILDYEPATKSQIRKILPYANQASSTLKFIEKRGLVKNDAGVLHMTPEGEAVLKHLNEKMTNYDE